MTTAPSTPPAQRLVAFEPALPPTLLFVGLPGAGEPADALRGLAGQFAEAFESAVVVLADGPQAAAAGHAESPPWQPNAGQVTALGSLLQALQQRFGVPPHATALVGHHEGATLALSLAARPSPPLSRVVAFGGRFAERPVQPMPQVLLHWLHGDDDRRVPVAHGHAALAALRELRSDATFDFLDGQADPADDGVIAVAIERLRSTLPSRVWQQALAGLHGLEGSADR